MSLPCDWAFLRFFVTGSTQRTFTPPPAPFCCVAHTQVNTSHHRLPRNLTSPLPQTASVIAMTTLASVHSCVLSSSKVRFGHAWLVTMMTWCFSPLTTPGRVRSVCLFHQPHQSLIWPKSDGDAGGIKLLRKRLIQVCVSDICIASF